MVNSGFQESFINANGLPFIAHNGSNHNFFLKRIAIKGLQNHVEKVESL